MTTVEIRGLINHGTIVTMLTVDLDSGRPLAIHFDQRPFHAFLTAWLAAGQPNPVAYDAERGTVSLEVETIIAVDSGRPA